MAYFDYNNWMNILCHEDCYDKMFEENRRWFSQELINSIYLEEYHSVSDPESLINEFDAKKNIGYNLKCLNMNTKSTKIFFLIYICF